MDGPGVIQHIWITVTDRTSDRNRYILRDLVLRMYWDGEETPSVESPLGDFFCCGFGVSYPVNSLPIAVNPTRGFNSYFSMPFGKKAKITIENQCDEAVNAFFYQVDYCLLDELPAETGYFHAVWRRQRLTEKAKDYVILDGVKGRGQMRNTLPSAGPEPRITSAGHGALQRRKTAAQWKIPSVRRFWAILTIPITIPSCIMITTTTIRCPSAASIGGIFRIR